MRPTNDCKLSFRQHVCKNHAPGQQTQPQMELFCPPLFPCHARCCRRQLQDFFVFLFEEWKLCFVCLLQRPPSAPSWPWSILVLVQFLEERCFLFVLLLVFIVFLLAVLFTLLQSTVGVGSCFSCAYLYMYVHTYTRSYIYIHINMYTYI